MSKKPELSVIEGGKIDVVELPERVEFECWKCKGWCVMFPRSKNATQHSIPVCKEWERIEKKKEDLERFLIKCGVHLLTKQGDA